MNSARQYSYPDELKVNRIEDSKLKSILIHPWIARGGNLFLLAVLLAGCGDAQRQPDRAQADVGGFSIEVEIAQSHLLLDEHRKRVEIRRGNTKMTAFTLTDPGGFAEIYVIDNGKQLQVVDGLGNGTSIDKASGKASVVEPNAIALDAGKGAVGTFQFGDNPRRYQWVPAKKRVEAAPGTANKAT
jgi:hypothetical protein